MMTTMAPTVLQTWYGFVRQDDAFPIAEAEIVADMFAPDMQRYCEFIQGAGCRGLMITGEGPQFTARAQALMQAWDMPLEGAAFHASLAELFDHKRAFLKLEWHNKEKVEHVEHLIAFYFRRRPSVKNYLEHLQQHNVQVDILKQILYLAEWLEKDSIHFAAAAVRPDRAVRHKLYFSQYITPEETDNVLHRLLEAMQRFDINSEARRHLAQHHHRLVSSEQATTIFVSVSFENKTLIPSLKIDYPDVSPQACAALLPPDKQNEAEAEVSNLCAGIGIKNLSYLGVRLNQTGPIQLKYYADILPDW